MRGRGTTQFWVCLYVDDLTYGGPTAELDQFERALTGAFKCKLEGPTNWMLEVQVNQGPNGRMTMSHSQYIMNVLTKHGMRDCRPVPTPSVPRQSPTRADCNPIGSMQETLASVHGNGNACHQQNSFPNV